MTFRMTMDPQSYDVYDGEIKIGNLQWHKTPRFVSDRTESYITIDNMRCLCLAWDKEFAELRKMKPNDIARSALLQAEINIDEAADALKDQPEAMKLLNKAADLIRDVSVGYLQKFNPLLPIGET